MQQLYFQDFILTFDTFLASCLERLHAVSIARAAGYARWFVFQVGSLSLFDMHVPRQPCVYDLDVWTDMDKDCGTPVTSKELANACHHCLLPSCA